MSDLIDRQAAIDEAEEWIKTYNSERGGQRERDAIKHVISGIKKLPPAQPQRIKGRWIRHPEQKNIYGGKCVECSECGEKYVVQYIEDEKYCRNCGADMRGEQDGQ